MESFNRTCKCHNGERGICACLGCIRGHKLANVIKVVLSLLVHNANLDIPTWANILDVVDTDENAQLLDPVLREILLLQNYELITLFSSKGIDACKTFANCTSPPIYAFATPRARRMKPQLNYLKTIQAVLDGLNMKRMSGLSGLKEKDFMNGQFNDYFTWEDTNVLLNAAITENPDFADFLLTHSDPFVKTSQNWTPLHAAAECGHENISKTLILQGMDPEAQGRRYIKTSEDMHPDGTLTSRRMDHKFFDHVWWANTTPLDIASMIKKPNEGFIQDCRKQYLEGQQYLEGVKAHQEETETEHIDTDDVQDENREAQNASTQV